MTQHTLPKKNQDSLGLLAGGVAHDFNNLLMAILGNADLALGELPEDSPARTSINEIHAVALRAADLCQQMLIYSGRGDFNLQVIELNHLTQGLAPLLESIVPVNVTLRHELSARMVFIKADFTRIQQVLLNLVTNATEALGDAEGVITIMTGVKNFTDDMLQNSLGDDPPPPGQFVFLRVSDTGSGMDPETLTRLFDPFFTTKFAGRGLGLSVVLGIAKSHRGAILVDSESGKGSAMTVLFPEAESKESAKQPAGTIENVESTWKPKGLVLLADDEPDVRRVAARMLKKMGFEVMLAKDGQEAVELFGDNADLIDMVVLDLTMPRLGGRETLHRIREIAPGIPVLLSSGYSENRFLAESAGFIQKPYTLARFREALRRVAETTPSQD
jgi:two-component system, cell cycle sensor histidine kinase and response regulator CckA